jgi:Flp pilus assembly protein TadB
MRARGDPARALENRVIFVYRNTKCTIRRCPINPKGKTMTVNQAVTAFAGIMVLLSVVLTIFVSPLWVWLTIFVGANLLQSAFTGFCPAAMAFKSFGFKSA